MVLSQVGRESLLLHGPRNGEAYGESLLLHGPRNGEAYAHTFSDCETREVLEYLPARKHMTKAGLRQGHYCPDPPWTAPDNCPMLRKGGLALQVHGSCCS